LSEHKNILFLEPIWLQKLVEDEELKQLFLKLKLSNGITLTTYPIEKEQIENAKNFILEIKKQNPSAKIGPLYIDYFYRGKLH
jgi:hypothetical protein